MKACTLQSYWSTASHPSGTESTFPHSWNGLKWFVCSVACSEWVKLNGSFLVLPSWMGGRSTALVHIQLFPLLNLKSKMCFEHTGKANVWSDIEKHETAFDTVEYCSNWLTYRQKTAQTLAFIMATVAFCRVTKASVNEGRFNVKPLDHTGSALAKRGCWVDRLHFARLQSTPVRIQEDMCDCSHRIQWHPSVSPSLRRRSIFSHVWSL